VLALFIPKLACCRLWVKGSTWIPIFDVDTSVDLGGLSKKVSNFVMGTPLLPSESELCPDTCTLCLILHPNIVLLSRCFFFPFLYLLIDLSLIQRYAALLRVREKKITN
jgi:hypothetical protein